MKIMIGSKEYQLFRRGTQGRYVKMELDDVTPGMELDMGTYAGREEVPGNPNVWLVRLEDGSYVETRGARVRVWVR